MNNSTWQNKPSWSQYYSCRVFQKFSSGTHKSLNLCNLGLFGFYFSFNKQIRRKPIRFLENTNITVSAPQLSFYSGVLFGEFPFPSYLKGTSLVDSLYEVVRRPGMTLAGALLLGAGSTCFINCILKSTQIYLKGFLFLNEINAVPALPILDTKRKSVIIEEVSTVKLEWKYFSKYFIEGDNRRHWWK